MYLFSKSLADLQRSSLYGAVSLKPKRLLWISKDIQHCLSSSTTLHSSGYFPACSVSWFLISVLSVQTSTMGLASSKNLVIFCFYVRPVFRRIFITVIIAAFLAHVCCVRKAQVSRIWHWIRPYSRRHIRRHKTRSGGYFSIQSRSG